MPLRIYTSNRMENLVEALAGVVREPLASPFTPEVIVVQSKGMQRWLAMELSRRFGVWANCRFPFPNSQVEQLFRAVLGDVPESSPFSPEIMTWRIAGLLPGLLAREEFSLLRHYLEGDGDGLKLYQLSGKIADTFDQYTLYRPDMLLAWEGGKAGDWQGILWNCLAEGGDGRHRGRIKEEFDRAMQGQAPPVENVPERISLFGISSLPAYHVEVFAAISRITEVNLFLLSPTGEYWADIVSAREKASRRPEERPLLTEGNPLLASLGKIGRDFSEMIVECGELATASRDMYDDTGGGSLLRQIQSDIFNLRGAESDAEKREISPDDLSVQIHSCHGPMREMEILHDSLLSMLETVPGLAPRDIVVMTPDIESYAPYISAVFEGCQDPARRIPFSIADRCLATGGVIAPVLLKLLGIPGSRLTVVQVLDILAAPPVCSRFGLDRDGLDTVRGWLETTRVRWGLDAGDRARLGLPAYGENSWKAGIDRLLLGYALPDENGRIFNGVLPFDGIEGTCPAILGSFLDFMGMVRDLAGRAGTSRSLAGWRDELRRILGDFFAADDETAHELESVTSILEAMGSLEAGAGYREPVDIAVVRAWLSDRLAREERGQGFMTGGVTFCAMLPMRSIPFRVMALVGMNDGAFPRQGRPPGFDLISASPRRGDRSLRDEDRYLFLESLLSARDRFYVSHVGQSIRDNSVIPPSVLVSELLDYLGRGFIVSGGDPVKHVVTMHRLQAFSRDYFTEGARLSSYSGENCDALLKRRGNPWRPSGFITAPLPDPPDEWSDLALPGLLRFFDNPSRFLLENRLGIRLQEPEAPMDEREPFGIDWLDRYQLKQEMVECILRGGDALDLLPVARCRGSLPPARHGEKVFRDVAAGVTGFAGAVGDLLAGSSPLEPLDFRFSLGGFTLTGRLDRIRSNRMVRYRCAKMKAKDLVRTWIEHLILNHLKEAGYPAETTLVMEDGSRTFAGIADPTPILLVMLELYREGLTAPLCFFPESSLAYARGMAWDIERARKKWESGFGDIPGEGDDPCFRLCFGEVDPFNEDFERVGQALFEPLLLNLVEE